MKERGKIMNSKYLDFVFWEKSHSGKTDIYHVMSKSQGISLGTIHWYGRWRRYTFSPNADTDFDPRCLDDISNFIKGLLNGRCKQIRNELPCM